MRQIRQKHRPHKLRTTFHTEKANLAEMYLMEDLLRKAYMNELNFVTASSVQ